MTLTWTDQSVEAGSIFLGGGGVEHLSWIPVESGIFTRNQGFSFRFHIDEVITVERIRYCALLLLAKLQR